MKFFQKINFIIVLIFIIVINNCKDIKRPSLFLSFLLPQNGSLGIITSDFSTSGYFFTMTSEGIVSPTRIPIHSDAVGFSIENDLIIVNRLQRDTIQIFDKNLSFFPKAEYSVGNGSNPHGIAYWQNKAYITLYEKNYILVVDKYSGNLINQIYIGAFSDTLVQNVPDGLPEQSGIVEYNNKIYVALQRLDRNNVNTIFPVTDYSLLLEINPLTDVVENSYIYNFKNPVSKLKKYNLFGNDCIISANAGNLGFNFAIDGGIEAFCFPSKTFQIILPETEVGGDILDFVIKNDTEAYAMVMYEDFSMGIFKFNPILAKVTKAVLFYSNNNGFAAGFELTSDGRLWIGENSRYPVIRIYETNNDIQLNIISLPQRPYEIFKIN